MGYVPKVVAREGGMTTPRTCREYLGECVILLIKKRRSDPSSLTSSRSRNWKGSSRELVSPSDRFPKPEGDGVLSYLLGVGT